tara:strand:+ start:388 stop:663 length:276 start_codon:yes stop_codon:yes gene_type:complete
MKIGQVVHQDYHNCQRLGVVRETFMKGNWKYLKIQWLNDEIYESAMDHLKNLRHEDLTHYEYRVDEVKPVDVGWWTKTLQDIIDYRDSEES